MNYSHFRLNILSETASIKAEMGEKQFFDYAIGIYKYFANMASGDEFDITKKVAKENAEKFIKIACLYSIDFPGHLQFNEAFTKITKL